MNGMKKFNIRQCRRSYLVLMAYIMSPYALAQSINSAELTVSVENLRNSAGVIQFSLYNKQGSIPDEHYSQYLFQQTEQISQASATTVFKNLPLADYAINILHDENMNGKIDKGFILPTEGIGFSQYSEINLLNRPNFKDASIKLNSDTKIKIQIIYF